ncbi:MAG: DUF3793 family protein [Lachnospiraceae bacterium]|nr:DUF3793 family protein [Lachnospiraceae bacterium]
MLTRKKVSMPILNIMNLRSNGDYMISLSLQLALNCAPVFMGQAVANTVALSREEADRIPLIFKNNDVSYRFLCEISGKQIVYFYRKEALYSYLNKEESLDLLREYGYEKGCDFLDVLSSRIKEYTGGMIGYPHEIGLFLGYPVSDVRSFIRYKGENYKITGYWKVYHNESHARKKFRIFDECREIAVNELIGGKKIINIIQRQEVI